MPNEATTMRRTTPAKQDDDQDDDDGTPVRIRIIDSILLACIFRTSQSSAITSSKYAIMGTWSLWSKTFSNSTSVAIRDDDDDAAAAAAAAALLLSRPL
jgi:hypothetical protein